MTSNNSTNIQIDADPQNEDVVPGTGNASDSFVESIRGRLNNAFNGFRLASGIMPNLAQVGTATIVQNNIQRPPVVAGAPLIPGAIQREPVLELPINAPIGNDPRMGRPQEQRPATNQRQNGSLTDTLEAAYGPGVRPILTALAKILPVVGILLLKLCYDKWWTLYALAVNASAYYFCDEFLRKEITKRQQKNNKKLYLLMFVAVAAMSDRVRVDPFILDTIRLLSFKTVTSFAELLYCALVTDYFLKSITVVIKAFITVMPERVVDIKRRGRIYVLVESISQFYRCLFPIQLWAAYLLSSYEGYERFFGALLVVLYSIFKLWEITTAGKFVLDSFQKFKHDSNYGKTPSNDRLLATGEQCSICHDPFNSPIELECRHIFCDSCISLWLDRENTCPLCRHKLAFDFKYRDGATAAYNQIY